MSQFPESNPYESPHSSPTPGGSYGDAKSLARSRLMLPAIFLLIIAPLAILGYGIDCAFRFVNDPADNPLLQNPDAQQVEAAYVGQMGFAVVEIIAIICQIVVIVGAIQMMQVKSHSMAKAAAIISCVPCLTGCCLLGIPFGIWTLVVLNDPTVRQAFET